MKDRHLYLLRPFGEDNLKWKNIISRFSAEKMDVHFTPDYTRIYELTYGKEAFLAVYGDEENYLIVPFSRNDVTQLPFWVSTGGQTSAYDIESLYGYGGPLLCLDKNLDSIKEELYKDFFKTFHDFCVSNNIIAEYYRFHPLLENHVPVKEYGPGKVDLIKPIIYIDLHQDLASLWQGICRGHRSSINKARRSGVTVEVAKVDGENLHVFELLYEETMERNQADPLWRFPASYFKNCIDCLGENRVALFNAKYNGEVIASYLVLHEYQTVYYHFGGSREIDFNLRANNLLIYEIALWAKSKGYRWFHLGGGIEPDDGVFRFKSGFSKDRARLYSYSCIHDQNKYSQLAAMKTAWDLSNKTISKPSHYFPVYRG
jgi:hypothetical protein